MSKRLEVKDLINIGLFSVLGFIFMMIGSFLAMVPVLMPVVPFAQGVLVGPVNMLYSTKIKKRGMIFIQSLLIALIYVAMGHGPWALLTAVIAGIIAEIGDIHRFDSQASVAKFAGLVWTQHQSGEFEAEHSRMIKSGNRYLRYYLLEAANSVRRCDSEFRRYYDLKFKEVNKYQHKRALALTARKLVRLVFRLLKDNRLYIPPES